MVSSAAEGRRAVEVALTLPDARYWSLLFAIVEEGFRRRSTNGFSSRSSAPGERATAIVVWGWGFPWCGRSRASMAAKRDARRDLVAARILRCC